MNISLSDGGSEYVFWLRGWVDKTVSFWAKLGQFKCIITRRQIHVIPVENDPDKELNLDILQIQTCELYGSEDLCRSVGLILNGRRVVLTPINPFDPKFIAQGNDNEASAMIEVIEAFRAGMNPQMQTNPYLRQLAASKAKYRFRELTKKWEQNAEELDQHISPWEYYHNYGDKFFLLRTLAFVLLSAVVVTALILCVAYVLDILNII